MHAIITIDKTISRILSHYQYTTSLIGSCIHLIKIEKRYDLSINKLLYKIKEIYLLNFVNAKN
jgi:hypothetical protein